MLELKAGATKLPAPVNVDLDQIMRTHPLITDFPPLPSQALIIAVIQGQQSSTSGRPPPPRPRGAPFIPRAPTPLPRGPGILIPTPSPQPTFAPPPPYTLPPPPSCWCCVDGQVFQTTAADCRQRDGQCYGSRKEAIKNCKPIDKICWCCIYGQIVRTTVADCRGREGQCYSSRKEATRNCGGRMQPPPPPRGPGIPTRTPPPKQTPSPLAQGTQPSVGKGQWPRPIKPPKKGTPTPTPSPTIF